MKDCNQANLRPSKFSNFVPYQFHGHCVVGEGYAGGMSKRLPRPRISLKQDWTVSAKCETGQSHQGKQYLRQSFMLRKDADQQMLLEQMLSFLVSQCYDFKPQSS